MIRQLLLAAAFAAIAGAQDAVTQASQATMRITGWTSAGELVAQADIGASWAPDASGAWAVRRIALPVAIDRSGATRVLLTATHAAELADLLVPAIAASSDLRDALAALTPRTTKPQAVEPACAYVRQRDDTSIVVSDCVREQVVTLTGTRACDLAAYIDRDGSLSWCGSCQTSPARPTSFLTPPIATRYLGYVRADAPCVAGRCVPRVTDVAPASRPTDVVPGWRAFVPMHAQMFP